jgi:acyl-CoA reductase-like NAD-dependent aldehyde dehydrogenase
MTPSARGALMYRIADMLPSLAPDLGAIETRDNGKLIADTRNRAAGHLRLRQISADRRRRDHHAVELAAADRRYEGRQRARRRLPGGDQAVRVHLRLDGPASPTASST